jgi:ribonuclease BN (tRNA processing enzyme)
MKLHILGAGGSWPAAGEATSGYLLADSGFVLAIDLGTGTFACLQQRMSAKAVSSVLITHAHPDHFVDIYALFYFRFFHQEPLPPVDHFLRGHSKRQGACEDRFGIRVSGACHCQEAVRLVPLNCASLPAARDEIGICS